MASAVSLTVDIDKIPDELKKVMIGQTANALAEQKDKLKEMNPNASEAELKLQAALIDEVADTFKMVVNDGGEFTLSLDVDRQKGDLSTSLSLAGKPGTKLAKTFTDLGAAKSIGAAAGTMAIAAYNRFIEGLEAYQAALNLISPPKK